MSAREVGSKAGVELISGALFADELLVEAAKGGDVRQLDRGARQGASLDGAAQLLRSQAHHRERCTPLHRACETATSRAPAPHRRGLRCRRPTAAAGRL